MDKSIGRAIPPWDQSGAKPTFVKEKVKSAAREIFMQIASGRYSFGTRLAAERDLANELGTTRTTIRQAIEFLEEHSVVTRRPNGGTFVVYRGLQSRPADDDASSSHTVLDITSIVEAASPFEMSVVCSILEPEMVRLATLYMSVRDLENLKRQIEDIEKIVTDAEQFAHQERQFLMAIAEGTHNRLLVTMYRIVDAVRRQPHWCSTRIQNLSPARILEEQKKLRSLYNALESRDIESAVEFVKLLIAGDQEIMLFAP